MSEHYLCPATIWKFQVVHREVLEWLNVEARVLEERIGENISLILSG